MRWKLSAPNKYYCQTQARSGTTGGYQSYTNFSGYLPGELFPIYFTTEQGTDHAWKQPRLLKLPNHGKSVSTEPKESPPSKRVVFSNLLAPELVRRNYSQRIYHNFADAV